MPAKILSFYRDIFQEIRRIFFNDVSRTMVIAFESHNDPKRIDRFIDLLHLSFEDEAGEECFPLNRFNNFIEENHAFLKIPNEINIRKGMKIKILRVEEKATWRVFEI